MPSLVHTKTCLLTGLSLYGHGSFDLSCTRKESLAASARFAMITIRQCLSCICYERVCRKINVYNCRCVCTRIKYLFFVNSVMQVKYFEKQCYIVDEADS